MHNVDPRISQPNIASFRQRLLDCMDENKHLVATVFKVAKIAAAIIVPILAFSFLSPLPAFAISIVTGTIYLYPFIKNCFFRCRETSEQYQGRTEIFNPNQHQPFIGRPNRVFGDERTHHGRHPVFEERSARTPTTFTRPQSPPHVPVGARHHESPSHNRDETFSHPRSAFRFPMHAAHVPVGTRTFPADRQPSAVPPQEARDLDDGAALYPPPPAMRTFPHPSPAALRTALGSRAPSFGRQDSSVPIAEEDPSRTNAHVGVGSRRPTASS